MSRGLQRERQVRYFMEQDDWVVVRAAGSLGCCDLVAMKSGRTPRMVEVKSTAQGPYEHFRPADRKDLSQAAEWAGAEAWLAWWPSRGQLTWFPESSWPSIPGEETDGRVAGTG